MTNRGELLNQTSQTAAVLTVEPKWPVVRSYHGYLKQNGNLKRILPYWNRPQVLTTRVETSQSL